VRYFLPFPFFLIAAASLAVAELVCGSKIFFVTLLIDEKIACAFSRSAERLRYFPSR
jgi:hypothetical protein